LRHKARVISFFIALSLICTAPPYAGEGAAEEIQLPEEEVTAAAEEDASLLSPGTVSVVRPEEMEGEHKNLPELLKEVPGLHVVESKGRGAYTVASVRGSTAAEVSVFVDGVLMNLGGESAVDLSAIPTANVERIEIYRGYVPARFAGASMGGVINIITKTPDKAGGALSLGAGSYGKFNTSLSYAMPLGGGSFFIGANYERSDGDFEYTNDNNTPYTPEDDYKAKRQNNGYKNSDVLLKWKNDDWSARFGWKRSDRDLPYAAPGADRDDSPQGAQLDTKQTDFSISRRFKSGAVDWGIKAEYLHQNKKYDDEENVLGGWGEQHNEYATDRYGFAIDGAWRLGENHLVEFLADYSKEKLRAEGDIVTTFGGTSDFRREAADVQLQDTISLSKDGTLTFTPIVRWNMWGGDSEFSFGAALSKELPRGWTIRASGGSYNRAPNLYELYGDGAFVRPNENLGWEDGSQWDLGVSWKGKLAGADASASLTYFGRRSNDLIEFVMTSPRYGQYINIGKARVNGIEFEGRAAWDKWDVKLSATWTDAKDATEDYREEQPLPNRPEWEGYLRLSRKFLKDDAATAFAELRYIGENYYDTAGSIKMDDLFTVGVGLHWRIRERLKLTLGVDDIFDEGPELKMYSVKNGPERTMWYPLQGRTFYATLTWEF